VSYVTGLAEHGAESFYRPGVPWQTVIMVGRKAYADEDNSRRRCMDVLR